MTLLNLYDDEANRGEKVALKFRWILIALVFSLIIIVTIKGDYKEAVVSSIIASIFGIYNLFLIYLFRKGKIFHWVRYLSVSLDIGLVSVHINLIYFLQFPNLDPAILNQIISTNPNGQVYKSIYLLFFGLLLLYIPDLVSRMIIRHAEIAEQKNQSEMRLTLEMKENEYFEEKLQYAKQINEQLNEKNEQIAFQNEKLKEMNATKDRLFSIIGHDLKNPFTVLISISQMIKDQLENLDMEDLRKSLDVINNASNQGFALLDNLLDWARSQTGEIKFTPVTFELNESVRKVLVQIGSLSERKQVSIKNNIQNAEVITADQNMVQTIFRNLISNAIKFSKPGGIVVLDAMFDQTTNKTVITITDHGVGITEENRSKLFDIKTHQSTKGTMQESGTGLGLLICKEFIEKHGGNIHVYSKTGEGTRITFNLPSISL